MKHSVPKFFLKSYSGGSIYRRLYYSQFGQGGRIVVFYHFASRKKHTIVNYEYLKIPISNFQQIQNSKFKSIKQMHPIFQNIQFSKEMQEKEWIKSV